MVPAFLLASPVALARASIAPCTLRMSNAKPPGMSRRTLVQTGVSAAALVALNNLAVPELVRADERKDKAAAKPTKLKFIKDDSGISYADMKVGNGPVPADGDFVIVDWIAYLSNGTVFDNTTSPGRNSVVFRLGQRKIIPGLEVALSTMRPGGVRKVIVPPKLAYGDKGVCIPDKGCLIPPGETLEYDLTLKRVAISPL